MVRARVLELLRAHGWNATSFQILEPGFAYFFDGDDAVVGYVDTGSAWVAAGAPIAPLARIPAVIAAFVAAARAAGRRASCFGTEARFADATGWPSLRIGDQPTWDPARWAATLKEKRSLREQLRRARAKGVAVRAVSVTELRDTPLRAQVDALIARWQASREMAPMGFLVQVDPFTFPDERRYFIAEREGRVVAFLGIVPIFSRGGWFFEDFLREPDAPNGTIELLVDAGMRAAATANVPFVTLGMVPLAGDVSPTLRAIRRAGRALYDFDGLRAFKAKFAPSGWDPIFLAHPPGTSSIPALVDTLRAFARGGLLRFGLETFLRGPAVVVRALAALLVVWTIVLALPISTRFFPSLAWQYGWVAFDVMLGGALFVLAWRWTRPLANLLATAVTLDALVTIAQALVYNVPRRAGPLDLVILAIAMLAPTLSAAMLWNARAARLA